MLRPMNTSPADLLWQVHRAALEGRSSATGAVLPKGLNKTPPGAQAAHHAMACFEALRRGESMPLRPASLDDMRAELAEKVAEKLAERFLTGVQIGPPDDPEPPPPPPTVTINNPDPSIGPPGDPPPPPPPSYLR